ncbi:MAG: chemoreceptor glutamine deamidase CheD [Pseudomonadales bacterium]|nr:chemoreceptor glutamine deamidase CheD [Pseudomonadales bacterium]
MNTAPEIPESFPGYEHIPRKWMRNLGTVVARVVPGEFYVTAENEAIETVLGSCIACCIRDKVNGIGGLNHFMLPEITSRTYDGEGYGKMGDWAMEFLINGILLNGGERRNLEVKYFGGAQLLAGLERSAIGERNIIFVQDYFRREKLSPIASDIGGDTPRKVLYYPHTGRVRLKKLASAAASRVASSEKSYAKKVNTEKLSAGSIDLF